jgi:predicted AlkP superfamily phosphohydrolase/phosphomutase
LDSQRDFPGERQEHLPDVIVTWNDAAPFTTLTSPRIGHIAGETADLRPGTHSPYGFLLVGGTGAPAGGHGSGHLADVAPTILRLLGLDLPDGMDGSPLRVLAPGAEPKF